MVEDLIVQNQSRYTIEQSTADPLAVYKAKSEQFQAECLSAESASDRYSILRTLVFLSLLIVGWLSLVRTSLPVAWLFVALALFVFVVMLHSRVMKRLQRIQRAQEFYAQRVDHMAGSWVGQGNNGARYIDSQHSYTSDLDVFGEGSLFEFVCGARTRPGQDTLAQWLSHGADIDTIVKRQGAIKELSNHLELREELALLDTTSANDQRRDDITDWIDEDYSFEKWQLVAATVLGVLALLALVAWGLGYGYLPLLLVIALEVPLYFSCFPQIKKMARQAELVSATLKDLAEVLGVIEKREFHSVLLKQLTDGFQSGNTVPSAQMEKLYSLVMNLNQAMKNQFFVPIAFLFGLPVHLAFRLEHWRSQTALRIAQWLEAVGQVEALASLARYGFENPENTYPTISPLSEGPVFNAVALSHPLIAKQNSVPNDIRLGSDQRLIMVSGSNMSGKSTLLRSIGTAVVLASCGAPVRAQKLELSRFNIGCAMRASDSLLHGESHFYAVISRIKCVVDLAKTQSQVLFLLDEILQGTNSHDRLIGAKGVIHQLMEYNAVGLVTTHDLALTRVVESLGNKAINIHFEDQIVDDKISFDYKIRAGVITRSNGLALMRLIGLRVDTDETTETTEN